MLILAGNASEGCIGSGVFLTDDPTATLSGPGSVTGEGIFQDSEGLYVGAGNTLMLAQ